MTNTKDALDAAREYCKDWPHEVYGPNDLVGFFEAGAEFGANRERERAKGLVENYEWLLGVMRNYLKPDAPVTEIRYTKTGELVDVYALLAENERLNKVLKQEVSNNDEWGCEFLGITIVREENKELKAKLAAVTEALKFYSSEWRSDVYVGPTTELLNDFGKLATETLEKLK